MLSNKTGGEHGREATAWGVAGHQSVGGRQLLSFASLVFLGFYFPVSLVGGFFLTIFFQFLLNY